jgi:hypothetical protein
VIILGSIGLAWVNTDLAKYIWLLMAVAARLVNNWVRRQAVPADGALPGNGGR